MLNIVRINNINLIPKHLIEQVDNRKYTVEDFISVNQFYMNSSTFIFEAILNENNTIIGFINYNIDPLEHEIYINILSLDKSHKCDGRTLDFVIDYFKDISSKTSYSIVWHCFKPLLFIKKGFKKVKGELLEYTAC